ncbi:MULTISPECIES: hypothetical protein [unclassified Sphingomonas]|uniref:hypothetical protein n=1 Tax=unclassified Sphingomonas TaxID=196159 RepID=UPI0028630240|nr:MULTISPECIES: hypothetical protein [unclassified Sphingomonas]MDR6114644.1 putative Zn-dependent protease [Sphingomonas sp. SORGH_AS_0789]MDR6151683.1 tetratricopeptide (TPR) repeat protein [Sphingomonas sp. SORGH_AS_0742]
MRRQSSQRWMAVALPVGAGVSVLALGLFLMPSAREVEQTARRAAPPPPPVASPAPPPAPAPPSALPHPELAAMLPTADAPTLARLTRTLIDTGVATSSLQVAYDLVAAGRPAVAIAYLAARPDGATPGTWAFRVETLRQLGRRAEAEALLAEAVRRPIGVAPPAIVAAGYALDRPDLLVAAVRSGAIPPPDVRLAHDLAQRAEAQGHGEWIAQLDQAGAADWRAADPWLALRVAQRIGDRAAAERAIAALPAAERERAHADWLTRTGDRAGLRRMLLARAAQPGAALPDLAERLLALGARDDAIALLRRAVAGQSPVSPEGQRLLYLMGPRPAPADREWLRQQAQSGPADEQGRWLAAYAERDSPAAALAFVQRHPLAGRTDIALLRLGLAQAAGERGAARAAMATLLDGRPLDPATLRRVSAWAGGLEPTQARALAERRVAAGMAGPRDRLDLAWAAWNAGDAARTRDLLRDHLAETPGDLSALRLMADAQARLGGAAAARPWLERALAQAPAGRVRAELLDRLGRRGEALALVTDLRRAAPRDTELAALQARLLIASGQPGRARAVLTP